MAFRAIIDRDSGRGYRFGRPGRGIARLSIGYGSNLLQAIALQRRGGWWKLQNKAF